jgi:ketopantoate reductase
MDRNEGDKGCNFPFHTKTSLQRDVDQPAQHDEGNLCGGTISRLGASLGVPTAVAERVYSRIDERKRTQGAPHAI